jgi:hypothetical protein
MLRLKCTRHLCQLEPASTRCTAALRPSCASLIDHCTRDNPRRFNDRRKVPSAATPNATITARDTTRPPVLRALT